MSGKRTQKLNLLKHTFDIVISIPQEDVVASVIGCRSTFFFFFNVAFVSLNYCALEPALETKVYSSAQTGVMFASLP